MFDAAEVFVRQIDEDFTLEKVSVIADLMNVVDWGDRDMLALKDAHVFVQSSLAYPVSDDAVYLLSVLNPVFVGAVTRVLNHVGPSYYAKDALGHRLHRTRHGKPFSVFCLVHVAWGCRG